MQLSINFPSSHSTTNFMNEEDLVPVFTPSLAALLLNLEAKKGSPLSREEVLQIRDNAVVMMMCRARAVEMAQQRGYDDLNPENCWEEFLALKQEMAS